MAARANTKKAPTPRRDPKPALAGGLIVLAAFAAYANSFRGAMIMDDLGAIVTNSTIRDLADVRKVLSAQLPPGVTVRGRPVVNLSLAFNYAIGGLRPQSYHVLNFAVHALAGLVLFGLVRRTLRLPSMPPHFGRAALPLATAGAMLWAVHPLTTGAVTYIVQRAESMMALCYLLTLYCLLRGATGRRPWAWYAGSIAACLAGMATKEVMVSAPLAALLYDRAFLAGSCRQAIRARKWLYAALAASWSLLATVAWGARGESAGFGAVSPWAYGGTQLWAIFHYLFLTIWPRELLFDYGEAWIVAPSQAILPALVVAALLVLTAVALWRHPKAGFLGACFFLILAPTSSIVPIATQTVAEHRMYLPLAAAVLLAVVGAYDLGRRVLARRKAVGWAAGAAAIAVLAAALGLRTYQRNADFASALGMWQDTLRKRPENPRAWYGLSRELLMQGRLDETAEALRQALRLQPKYVPARCLLAWCYAEHGDLPTAAEEYSGVIQVTPEAPVYNDRGICYRKMKQYALAMADFNQAITIDPGYPLAYYNRGLCWEAQGDIPKAIHDLDRALEIGWDGAAIAYVARGRCRETSRRPDLAVKDFQKAVELSPDNASYWTDLASAQGELGEADKSAYAFRRAIDLNPGYARAYAGRARLWAGLAEYEKAWADVRRARQLGGSLDPQFLKELSDASGRMGP